MWIAPTTDAVLSEFTAQEASSIRAAQKADNLASILSRVVAEIRDSIRGGGYDLDADETKIPLGLHNAAIAITRWRLLISIPALKTLQTEDRKSLYEDAQKRLRDISQQQFSVESPSTDTPAKKTGNWNSENKIIGRMHPVPPPATQFQPVTPPAYANPDAPADGGN